jgi:hypothetical protein
LQRFNLRFQLLYSTFISIQYHIWNAGCAVTLTRYSQKIFYPVIVLDSIKMMYYPTIRDWFSVTFFPYYYMLKNPTAIISTQMSSLDYFNISSRRQSATAFPTRMVFSYPKLDSTFFAHLRRWSVKHGVTTLGARLLSVGNSPSFNILKPTFLFGANGCTLKTLAVGI